jgi:hypothetical protein
MEERREIGAGEGKGGRNEEDQGERAAGSLKKDPGLIRAGR